MLEHKIKTPSPAPDLTPAENRWASTGNSRSGSYVRWSRVRKERTVAPRQHLSAVPMSSISMI